MTNDDGSTTQYAIRLPNGLLYSYDPPMFDITQQGGYIYLQPKDANEPAPPPEPIVYDSAEEAEGSLKKLQHAAARLGIAHWFGRIETRHCSPFTDTDPAQGMVDDVEKFLGDQ